MWISRSGSMLRAISALLIVPDSLPETWIEMICARPIERIAILHTMAPDVEEFKAEVIRRAGLDAATVTVATVGPSVGPHLGPGCVGAAVLYKR